MVRRAVACDRFRHSQGPMTRRVCDQFSWAGTPPVMSSVAKRSRDIWHRKRRTLQSRPDPSTSLGVTRPIRVIVLDGDGGTTRNEVTHQGGVRKLPVCISACLSLQWNRRFIARYNLYNGEDVACRYLRPRRAGRSRRTASTTVPVSCCGLSSVWRHWSPSGKTQVCHSFANKGVRRNSS